MLLLVEAVCGLKVSQRVRVELLAKRRVGPNGLDCVRIPENPRGVAPFADSHAVTHYHQVVVLRVLPPFPRTFPWVRGAGRGWVRRNAPVIFARLHLRLV